MELHAKRLIDEGFTTRETVDEMVSDYRKALDHGGGIALNIVTGLENQSARDWASIAGGDVNEVSGTAVPVSASRPLARNCWSYLTVQIASRVAKIMENRGKCWPATYRETGGLPRPGLWHFARRRLPDTDFRSG